jgi:hypothetical protein
MRSQFHHIRPKKSNVAFAVAVASLLVFGPAQAQQSIAMPGVTVSSPMTTMPTPAPLPPIGINVSGWQQSSSIGSGYNTGGDPAKQNVMTVADGVFRIGADTYLTGNSNPDCKVDCKDTMAKLWITGEQITGARSVNEGLGTATAPVSSVAGTNGSFSAGLKVEW